MGRFRGGFGRRFGLGTLLFADFCHHVFALFVAGDAEFLPPFGQIFFDLTRLGAQAHEIETGAEARLVDHAKRRAAHAFFKTRLHHPNLAHVARQFAATGHIADTGVENIVYCLLQGGETVLALPFTRILALCPAVAHVGPEHAGQQEAGHDGLAFTDAAIGVFQGDANQGLVGTLDHHVQKRVDAFGHAQFVERGDAALGVAGLQELEHFVKQAALWHVGQQFLRGHQRRGGFGLQFEAQRRELGGEAHGTDDADRVFAVAGSGVANHADDALFSVFQAAVVVDDDLRFGVVIHGVDGEIAAHGVFFHRAPDVVAQDATSRVNRVFHASQLGFAGFFIAFDLLRRSVVQVGAEGGNLDHLMFAAPAVDDVDDAKATADDKSTAEQLLDLLGRGVGGDVKVLGAQPDQQVAHRTAHDVGLKTRVFQGTNHIHGLVIDQTDVNPVDSDAYVFAFAEFRTLGTFGSGTFGNF